MRICGLVQARMGSARLPGKVMKPLAGIPLVGHIFDRMRRIDRLEAVVLATTDSSLNVPLKEFSRSRNIPVFSHPLEDDIIARLVGAAEMMEADAILKVNADCPLVDPDLMNILLDRFLSVSDADFASNKLCPSFPLGYSLELISVGTLRFCNERLSNPEDRELAIQWIMDHRGCFKTVSMEHQSDLSHLNLTVDTPEDFALANRIFDALYSADPVFGMDATLGWLDNNQAD